MTRARFGYEEAETNLSTWLGGLEHAERPWPKEGNREDYLAELAQRETPIHALDVKGYREHAHASLAAFSDEQLLVLLHEWRAISNYIPEVARKESEAWLSKHDDLRFRNKARD